jgi:hypothetical protein
VNHRRTVVAGVAVLAVLSLGLAACGSSSALATGGSTSAAAPSSPATSAPPSADAALVGSIAAISGQSYDLTLSAAGSTGSGSVDPSDRALHFDAQASQDGNKLKLGLTVIGTDLWVKLDLGPLNKQAGLNPAKWIKVDASKIDLSSLGIDILNSTDVLDLTPMQKAMSNAKLADPTHVTGTIDLTALTGVVSPDSDALTKAGAAAKTVPFTVTLDNQGRLKELKIDGDSIATGLSLDIGVSNVGSGKKVAAPPASQVIPAPSVIYQILGSS